MEVLNPIPGILYYQIQKILSAYFENLINHLTSVITVSSLSKHSSGPGCKTHPEGPQRSLGTFLQSVSGVYLSTVLVSFEHTSRGHLVHFCSVV